MAKLQDNENSASPPYAYRVHKPPDLAAQWWSIDLLPLGCSGYHEIPALYTETSTPALRFLYSASATCSPVRFLLARTAGFIVRNDFLEHRLEHSPRITKAETFPDPLQEVERVPWQQEIHPIRFAEFLNKAIGGVQLSTETCLAPEVSFRELDDELRKRISFPWVVGERLERRRIAWVWGGKGLEGMECVLQTAAALGIRVVVMHEPGHLSHRSHRRWAHSWEAFFEVDITANEGLAKRIVHAVLKYPKRIDGIVTFSKTRLASVAAACAELDLPTQDPKSHMSANDKGLTRLCEKSLGMYPPFTTLSPSTALRSISQPLQIPFPLIIKPTLTTPTSCAPAKASNRTELQIAFHRASTSATVLIEPYITGPETTATLILHNTHLLSITISDSFPRDADTDLKCRGALANFNPTQTLLPSALPEEELELIQKQLYESVRNMGFTNGVFRCTARVRGSSMRYDWNTDVWTLDLLQDPDFRPQRGGKTVYLHSIRACPPSHLETRAAALAYGVDYTALHLLFALGPDKVKARIRALAQQVVDGPPCWVSVVMIPQVGKGRMKTVDAGREFVENFPEVGGWVVGCETWKKGGNALDGPGAGAVAGVAVVSRRSRAEVLERVDFVQLNFGYEVEEGEEEDVL